MSVYAMCANGRQIDRYGFFVNIIVGSYRICLTYWYSLCSILKTLLHF